ncbi:MAG: hypothetical protein M3Z26_08295 [Bacteroidota bacterium]|nr:hypothetical protein [Bacteroidota bacterium]
MKIAILTRANYRSPRILAEALKSQLELKKATVEIYYELNILNRLVSYKNSKLNFHFWLKKKLLNYIRDKQRIKKLKQYDAIIISECCPNAFWKKLYNIEKLKKIFQKPVLFYEVYYLGNAPYQIKKLTDNDEPLIDRYDLHLAVSEVTEIRQKPSDKWFGIGLYAKSWNLFPLPKKEFIAIVDFIQKGFENYRQVQINALNKAGIKYIILEKEYDISGIREIYKNGALFFLQFPEAFGISTLECLCTGNQIFTPDSNWPLSWRLDKNPTLYSKGTLPECFTVYNDEEDLVKKLVSFKDQYDLINTPQLIFQCLIKTYPSFYYGNENELLRVLNNLKNT